MLGVASTLRLPVLVPRRGWRAVTAVVSGAALPAEGHTAWRGVGCDDSWSVVVEYDSSERALHVMVWSGEEGQGCAVPLDRTVGLRDLLLEAHGLPDITGAQADIDSQRDDLQQAVSKAINEGYAAGQRFADAHHALKAAEEKFQREVSALPGLIDTAHAVAKAAFPPPQVEGSEGPDEVVE